MNNYYQSKLTAAIFDLENTIPRLMNMGRKSDAQNILLMVTEYVSDVFGGNAEVRALMDQYNSLHSKSYVMLYS